MIVIPILIGVLCSVWVNGLADNLLREEYAPLSASFVPRCSYCDSPRKAADWSAVVSNLFFSGVCLRCGAPRPFRDLMVEAVLWIGIPALWMTGWSDVQNLLIGTLVLSAFLLFIVLDVEHRTVLVEAVGLVGVFLVVDAWFRGADVLLQTVVGGAAGFLIFLGLFFFGRLLAVAFKLGGGIEPLGFGDVILAALIGLAVGWPGILLVVLGSIVLGGIAGLLILFWSWLRKNPVRNATMAYGPYLLAAGMLVYFYAGVFAEAARRVLEGP